MSIDKYLKKAYYKSNKNLLFSVITLLLAIIFIYLTLTNNIFYIVPAGALGILSIIFIIKSTSDRKNIKTLYSGYSNVLLEDITKELNDIIYNDEEHSTIYTKNYILNYDNNFDIIRYSNIVWSYPYIVRYNGKEKIWNVALITADKKRHLVNNIDKFERVDNNYNDLINFISKNNPNMVIGYTKENIEMFNNLYQNN